MRLLQRDGADERLTNLQNAVLWLLHSWQKRITAQGLATQLRCGRRSVYRAVDVLQALGLLDSFWETTISRRHLSLWQDKKEHTSAEQGRIPAGGMRSHHGAMRLVSLRLEQVQLLRQSRSSSFICSISPRSR